MRWAYTGLYTLLLPLIFLRLLWRSLKSPGYRQRWAERLGVFPAPDGKERKQGCIWVHAVSVGETVAAAPFIKALQQRWPEKRLVVTSMTPTGSAQVRRLFSDSVFHVYAPYDLPFIVNAFLDRVRPELAIIMETELWPNLIQGCNNRNIPVLVANARLSEKSLQGYLRFAGLSRRMLAGVSRVAAQTGQDKTHFLKLGLAEEAATVTGNIKFDLTLEDSLRHSARELKENLRGQGGRQIWIAASTHQGEEKIILRVFKQELEQCPDLLLLLVPRHPERFDGVADLCARNNLSVIRRSEGGDPEPHHQVLLADTMGELLLLFGAADVAFVGGSLVPVGGHNMIEAAAWGLPILTGPHLFNFREASGLLTAAGAMTVCEDADQLHDKLGQLLSDSQLRTRQGQSALRVANDNRGALQKLLLLVESTLARPGSQDY